jgi:hypothetical protein
MGRRRESQREGWTSANSRAAVGYAADAMWAAERFNAVELAVWCGGCGGDSGGKWLVVETAVASGWWWRQRWQVAGSGDSGGKWLVVETAVASGWWWRQRGGGAVAGGRASTKTEAV